MGGGTNGQADQCRCSQYTPHCPKMNKTNSIQYVTTNRIHPGCFCSPDIVVLKHGVHDIAIVPQVAVHIYCVLVHTGYVSQKLVQIPISCLYILYLRPTQSIRKGFMNANDTYSCISPCKGHLVLRKC